MKQLKRHCTVYFSAEVLHAARRIHHASSGVLTVKHGRKRCNFGARDSWQRLLGARSYVQAACTCMNVAVETHGYGLDGAHEDRFQTKIPRMFLPEAKA